MILLYFLVGFFFGLRGDFEFYQLRDDYRPLLRLFYSIHYLPPLDSYGALKKQIRLKFLFLLDILALQVVLFSADNLWIQIAGLGKIVMSNQIMLEVGRYTVRFINLIEDLLRIFTAVFGV